MISRYFCPLDTFGDVDNTVLYSRCPPYGSSKAARYLDADNSFSRFPRLTLPPLLCLVSRALLLPLSPALSRIPCYFFIYSLLP